MEGSGSVNRQIFEPLSCLQTKCRRPATVSGLFARSIRTLAAGFEKEKAEKTGLPQKNFRRETLLLTCAYAKKLSTNELLFSLAA
jgi:hypothetical protein